MEKGTRKALAMILAGGRGRRMGVLCEQRAKPALPFGGQHRVIDFVLNNCRNSQIQPVAVLTDYLGSQLADYVRGWGAANGAPAIKVLPPREGSYKGTADAIMQNLDYVLAQRAERILILAGDHIYNMDYREMLARHEELQADVSVAAVRVPIETAHRFGTLKSDETGRIVEFVEKSSHPASNLASMGIYVFNRRVLIERLCEDAADPNSPHDFGYAILPGMIKQNRVVAFEYHDYWRDIGTIPAYYAANMELLNGQHYHSSGGRWPLLESAPGLLSADIRGAVVNSLVSPGCTVLGLVQNSILSSGVFVGEKSIVRDSIVLPDCQIGRECLVEGCILEEGVKVKDSSRLGSAADSGSQRPAAVIGPEVCEQPVARSERREVARLAPN